MLQLNYITVNLNNTFVSSSVHVVKASNFLLRNDKRLTDHIIYEIEWLTAKIKKNVAQQLNLVQHTLQ